jgi:serpin B
VKTISLPYGSGDLSMVVILPDDEDGLDALEKGLTLEQYESLTTAPGSRDEVSVILPRFKMEKAFSLARALQSMGIRKAFDVNDADFTGITNDTTGLFIGAAVHKAFVDVNEKGTEAAAATGMKLEKKSKARQFKADHSFIYTIVHNETGLILFMGRCHDPAP